MQKNDGKKVKDRGGESDREKESYSLRTVFIQLELTVSLHQRNILEISFLYISFFNYCFPEKSPPPSPLCHRKILSNRACFAYFHLSSNSVFVQSGI